jgi:putative transposase
MARLARVVIPGIPHHVTQRGNRRQTIFFAAEDYEKYKELLIRSCNEYRLDIWAYCLMPNHVHLIAVPEAEDSLRLAIGETHRSYTVWMNLKHGWTGHLWQGRFSSCPMDNHHLLAAVRYVGLNPVRAQLSPCADEYGYSSVRSYVYGVEDRPVNPAPLNELINDWKEFFAIDLDQETADMVRRHGRTGRPLGDDRFIEKLEKATGRRLKAQRI